MNTKSKCVHCGEVVNEWTRDCPKCGRPVANPDAPLVSDLRSKTKWKTNAHYKKRNTAPFIIMIAVIIIIGVVYYFLKY